MALNGTGLRAQVSEKNNFEQRSMRNDQPLIQYQQNLQNVKIAVMDGPIDPAEYVVGPGDIYSINVWISPPISFQIPVTPEGSIIVPTVGEIRVAGLHLDEAKERVVATIRKKYISGDVSFVLLTPRMFTVTVKGVVKNEGVVYLQANERVDAAIELANGGGNNLQRAETPSVGRHTSSGNTITMSDTAGSYRKIVIRHKDGTQGSADLEKYFIQRDRRSNPLLREGDIIIVPKKNIERDFIGVYGAVNREGAYEFVPGDSLLSLLKIARGLTALADSNHAEVTRSDENGRSFKTISVNIASIVSKWSQDVPLHRGDRIVVKDRLELSRDYKVHVEGEVQYPGYYPISKDSTTLSEIVEKAGGFKEMASLRGSQLLRNANSSKDIDWERLENARGGTSQEDSLYYRLESEIRLNGELVVTDFVGLFVGKDKSKEVFLQDGDRIIIAARKKTVYVFGQVVQPGHVSFLSDQSYKYYVEKAGGFTEDAVKGDLRVIKAGSKQWLAPNETTIEDGDYLWVPKEPYRPFSYYMQIYSQMFSILATLATLTVLVTQLKK
jgi:protein involved in polysaccharide export with SLBB domain